MRLFTLPPNQVYLDIAALMEDIQTWAIARGYIFSSNKSEYDKDGRLRKRHFRCDHHAKARKSSNISSGCIIRGFVERDLSDNAWTFHMQQGRPVHESEPLRDEHCQQQGSTPVLPHQNSVLTSPLQPTKQRAAFEKATREGLNDAREELESTVEQATKRQFERMSQELASLGAHRYVLDILRQGPPETLAVRFQETKSDLLERKLRNAAFNEDIDLNMELHAERTRLSGGLDHMWETLDEFCLEHPPKWRQERRLFENWAQKTGYIRHGTREEGSAMMAFRRFRCRQGVPQNIGGEERVNGNGKNLSTQDPATAGRSRDQQQRMAQARACYPWDTRRRAMKSGCLKQEGNRPDGIKVRRRLADSPTKDTRPSKKSKHDQFRISGNLGLPVHARREIQRRDLQQRFPNIYLNLHTDPV